jgi:phage baseplate assembly protein W
MRDLLSGSDFPFRILGGLARSSGSEKIAADLRHLLSVRVGERVMLRTYGGGAHHRLQEANDSTLQALLKHEIEEGLRVFMPEVELTEPLRVTGREEELTVAIAYRADPLAMVHRLEIQLP